MHRFFTLVCAVATATSLVVGCGSSGDDSAPASGGSGGSGASGGSGGASSGTKCVGAYADLTDSAFIAATKPELGCTADGATACSNDMAAITGMCGKTCLLMAQSDDASQAECVAVCINENVPAATPISESCLSCYTTDVACARHNCLIQCGTAPTSASCAQCRVDMGCAAPFYACSGLPTPTGLVLGNGAAGAGDGSSGAGG